MPTAQPPQQRHVAAAHCAASMLMVLTRAAPSAPAHVAIPEREKDWSSVRVFPNRCTCDAVEPGRMSVKEADSGAGRLCSGANRQAALAVDTAHLKADASPARPRIMDASHKAFKSIVPLRGPVRPTAPAGLPLFSCADPVLTQSSELTDSKTRFLKARALRDGTMSGLDRSGAAPVAGAWPCVGCVAQRASGSQRHIDRNRR